MLLADNMKYICITMTYQDPFKVYSTPPSTSFIRGINVLFHTYRLIFNPFTDIRILHRIPFALISGFLLV